MSRERDADADFELAHCDCGGARRCRRTVGFSGWRREKRCMGVGFVHAGAYRPPRIFLDVVALLAQSETVVRGGRTAAGPRLRVVAVPDRRVAVGSAAALITQPDERGQALREEPCP